MNVSSIKDLLHRYGLRPNKSLGQNFLVDRTHLQRIVAAAEVSSGDTVLEIGPGLGALTDYLLEDEANVTAVEVDRGFIRILQDRFGTHPRFTLHHADILKTPVSDLITPPYKVVANIPYYITSAVIRHLLESTTPPSSFVLLMQKEVAQRVCAAPGNLSLLAISVQFYGTPEIVGIVPAGAFFPAPSVDSAILRVRPFAGPRYIVEDSEFFWQVVKAGFGQKRKQLKNSLVGGLPRFNAANVEAALSAAGIVPSRRAQTLEIAEWVALSNAFRNQLDVPA